VKVDQPRVRSFFINFDSSHSSSSGSPEIKFVGGPEQDRTKEEEDCDKSFDHGSANDDEDSSEE